MNFPRVELHCHLDGAIPEDIFYELSKKHGFVGETTSQEEWVANTRLKESMPLVECLKRFDLFLALLQTKEELASVCESLGNSLYEQGIRLAEVRFAPQSHTQKEMSQKDAFEAVLEGRRRVLEKHPDFVYGIIACMMHAVVGDNYNENKETVELAIEYKNKGIVGIDLAGAETAQPVDSYRDLYELAQKNGVHVTIHAGESAGAISVQRALTCHPERIGHGIQAATDEAVLKELAKRDVICEVSVTSNVLSNAVSSLEEHPIRKMFDLGVPVCINTDDALLCDCTLEGEYQLIKKHFGFTDKEIIYMNLCAAKASFCEGKEKIIAKLESIYTSL